MQRLPALALLIPLAAVSCRSLEPIPLDPALVEEVRTALGARTEELPAVKAVPTPYYRGYAAVTRGDEILVAETGRRDLEDTLAHELVHFYLPDSPLRDLPGFLEEGLALWLGGELSGRGRERFEEVADRHAPRGWREIDGPEPPVGFFSFTIDPEQLYLSKEDFFDDDQVMQIQRRELADLGFVIVHELGLERLRALAAEGADPLEYMRQAGLGGPASLLEIGLRYRN